MILFQFLFLFQIIQAKENHVAVSINKLPEDLMYNKTYFDIIQYTFNKHKVDVVLHSYHADPDNLTTVQDTFNQMVKDGINYAIIGDTISSTTTELVVCRDYYVCKTKSSEIPIISNSATSDTLTNKIDYPNFIRTIPVDSAAYQSIIEFIYMFKFKKIAMIYSNDPSGTSGYFRVNKLCNEKNIALLGIQYGDKMDKMNQLNGIDVIVSNMYMEELFNTWKRYPKVLEEKMWILTDAAMVISENDFTSNGFKDVLNKKTNVVIASLLSEENEIVKELKNKFGNPLPPLGLGYYDAVTTLVKGYEKGKGIYSFKDFVSVSFDGATGKVSFDENGDRVGIIGINRLLIGNGGYPLISKYDNKKMTFENDWERYLMGFTKDNLLSNGGYSHLIMFIVVVLFILI